MELMEIKKYWDIKYYYGIHVARMQADDENPVSYPQFCLRLRSGFNLHDAVYTPRVESQVRHRKWTPIQDDIRRKSVLNNNNIAVVDLDDLEQYEEEKPFTPMIPKPRQSWRRRFLSLFR